MYKNNAEVAMVMTLEDVAELLPESVQQMVDLVGFPTVEKLLHILVVQLFGLLTEYTISKT
ncbi:Uncharacterised protein [Rodentibacter pneumotropicus]|uniref:Uncharacterized protein n=1 Tax=Rodentibacter pneumotropicus TaxID=758 RepID=A0A3S5ES77_9PAST|nr:Uncharacterised protein [Rodentibacter pneumotropicus]